jgi:hypothetical protein
MCHEQATVGDASQPKKTDELERPDPVAGIGDTSVIRRHLQESKRITIVLGASSTLLCLEVEYPEALIHRYCQETPVRANAQPDLAVCVILRPQRSALGGAKLQAGFTALPPQMVVLLIPEQVMEGRPPATVGAPAHN